MEETEKIPYGFIYITTNLVNGMRYIGQKKIDGKHKSYLGSGVRLIRAIKKYGRENFTRVIVSFAYSPEELNKQEQDLIAFFHADTSEDYYNIEKGGLSYSLSEHTKQLISLHHADMSGEKNPNYGKPRSEETKRKISESKKGSIPWNKGIPMSEEQKEKLKEAWKTREKRVGHHREIICVETGVKYFSITEAGHQLGISPGSISAVLSGKRNSVYKKHFIYADSKEEKNNE